MPTADDSRARVLVLRGSSRRVALAPAQPMAALSPSSQRSRLATRRLARVTVCLTLAGALGCRSTAGSAERARASSEPAPTIAAVSTTDAAFAGPDAGASADATTQVDAAQELPELSAPAPIVTLPVPGFRDAVVSIPLGAKDRRPVLVALHGNYDRPEWQCEVWRDIAGARAFVLCPRGVPRDDAPKSEDRWTYATLERTERELQAALEALGNRFPLHAVTDRVVFTGFSLGAIQGRGILKRGSKRFARAVLTEGGYDGMSPSSAKALADAGVERVLFACGQSACVAGARVAIRSLERAGIEARVVSGGNVGHTYDGRVAQAIQREWSFIVEKEPMWDGVLD